MRWIACQCPGDPSSGGPVDSIREFFDKHLAFIVGTMATAIAIYFVEKKRARKVKRKAQELGFRYEAHKRFDEDMERKGFRILRAAGHGVQNYMEKEIDGVLVSAFGCMYTKNEFLSRKVDFRWQTVVMFKFEESNFPYFELRPESFVDRIMQFLYIDDIDFESNPVFSDNHFLTGIDEKAIRALFDATKVDALAAKRGISIEARDEYLLFYKDSHRPKVEDLNEFLKEACAIWRIFSERAIEILQ